MGDERGGYLSLRPFWPTGDARRPKQSIDYSIGIPLETATPFFSPLASSSIKAL